ncbi:hypothetical protein E1301_Tti004552 [Triplophysa tibetana]|uniref:Uncharacterized protein n=1 Tax=Triplophysa tibetana TaxID=1572043 RepID=A0A5A9N7T5_9TELE|nr:hypothetical protein E1301_Tti004552 [Triplophysa tibetana]
MEFRRLVKRPCGVISHNRGHDNKQDGVSTQTKPSGDECLNPSASPLKRDGERLGTLDELQTMNQMYLDIKAKCNRAIRNMKAVQKAGEPKWLAVVLNRRAQRYSRWGTTVPELKGLNRESTLECDCKLTEVNVAYEATCLSGHADSL